MLNMKVKDYIIKSDDNNVTVEKIRRDEKGQAKKDSKGLEATSLVGYYRDLEKALKGIQKNYVYGSETEITDIEEYKNKLEEITNEFNVSLKL